MPHGSPRSNSASVIALFIPSPRIGGGERVMVDLANAFAQRGHKVDLVVLMESGQFSSQLDPNIRVISIHARRILLSLPKLISYLRRERPSVLMALDQYNHLLALAARYLSGTNTRIVLRIGSMLSRQYGLYTRWGDRLIPILSRRWYPHADAVIAVSQGVARDVAAACMVPPEKIATVFNPKNIETIRQASREPLTHKWLGEHKDRPVVIAGGRLRSGKGFEDLFDAFALLTEKIPSRLIILGPSGTVTTNGFAAHVARLGITEDVDFVGYVDNPHAYTARADIFVMPSHSEGLPNALIEALLCGTPIVSTDCNSGPREILAPETDPFKRITEGVEWATYGALVPVRGIADMAEALTTLATDPALREQYRQAEALRAPAFDEEKIVGEYLNVLMP